MIFLGILISCLCVAAFVAFGIDPSISILPWKEVRRPPKDPNGQLLMYRLHLLKSQWFRRKCPFCPENEEVRAELTEANLLWLEEHERAQRTGHELGIHKIVAPDPRNEGLHDHPWDFASIVIWPPRGWYDEAYVPEDAPRHVKHRRRRWLSFAFHSATYTHAVVGLKGPVYTLFWTSPRKRIWGFPKRAEKSTNTFVAKGARKESFTLYYGRRTVCPKENEQMELESLEDVRKALNILQVRFDDRGMEIARLTSLIDVKFKAEIEELRETLRVRDNLISTLTSQSRAREETVTTLRHSLAKRDLEEHSATEKLEAEIEELRECGRNQEETISVLMSERRTLDVRVDELAHEREKDALQVDVFKTDNARLRALLSQANGDTEALAKQIKMHCRELEMRRQLIDDLRVARNDAEAAIAELRVENRDLSRRLDKEGL